MLHIFSAIVTLFTFSKGKKEEVKKEIQEEKKREMVEVVDLEDYPSTEITELVLYPCIGVQGIPIQKAKLTKTGFEYDRCWFWIQKVINKITMFWNNNIAFRSQKVNGNKLVSKSVKRWEN